MLPPGATPTIAFTINPIGPEGLPMDKQIVVVADPSLYVLVRDLLLEHTKRQQQHAALDNLKKAIDTGITSDGVTFNHQDRFRGEGNLN